MREGEEQEKLKKYPRTTIRIRMPDHTIVQAVFQSRERGMYIGNFFFKCVLQIIKVFVTSFRIIRIHQITTGNT